VTERVVIVGAGPAGCAAAAQCARLGVRPRLLDRKGRAGGLVTQAYRIENNPGLEPMPGPVFAERIAAHIARFGIEVERAEVALIERDGDDLLLRGSFGAIEAHTAIVAVGTVARPLEIPGAADLVAPPAGRLFHEVRALLATLPAVQRVLVVGSGEAALDYALTLADAGARVRVLARGPQPRARARGRLVELARGHSRIEIACGVLPRRLSGDSKGIALAVTAAGVESIERADAILVAIGRDSAAGPLLDTTATAVPGLFIAGDARCGGLGQAGIAVGDGLAAAMAAVAHLERDP
jgi:thioredoxin reductase (NADPH)